MADLSDLSLIQASEGMRRGDVTAVALVEFFLDRIAALDDHVRAWAHVAAESALGAAHGLDRLRRAGSWLGPLHGIPVGVKDTFDTAGIPSEAGSPLRKDVVPVRDAAVVARLKAAGAVLLGKTACTELGHAFPGPTRNPWNLDHTPGGSSSGSAAALAAGMCLGAVGSQTMGSIIRPAAYCGVVGVKATGGLLSTAGMVPLAPTLDTPGPMARTVRDAAVLLRALTRGRARSRPRGAMRAAVGVAPGFFRCPSRATEQCFDDALRVLRGEGHEVRDVTLPKSFEAAGIAAAIIADAETAALQLDAFRDRPLDLSETYRRAIQRGLIIPAPSYVHARRLLAAARREVAMALRRAGVDVLATPATPGPAPAGLTSTGDPSFNAPFTALGLPAVTVPMGFADGLPLGLQLVGWPFEDAVVLDVATRYEAVTDWTSCRPRLRACLHRAVPGRRAPNRTGPSDEPSEA